MARLTLIAATAFCLLGFSAQAQNTLDIYWIDADGGAATLVVTPERESVLMDAGYKLPDDGHATRVVAAMKDAGIDSLDYFIASHFHGDHVGGVEALASLVTIGEFVSHGDSVEQTTERGRPAWEAYLAGANLAERRSPTPVRPGTSCRWQASTSRSCRRISKSRFVRSIRRARMHSVRTQIPVHRIRGKTRAVSVTWSAWETSNFLISVI